MNIASKSEKDDGLSSNKSLSHAQRFRMRSGLLAEFVALRQRLPEMEMIHPRPIKVMIDEQYDTLSEEEKEKYNKKLEKMKQQVKGQPRDPYERENAIFVSYCRVRLLRMKPERIRILDSIHSGILSPTKSSHRRSFSLQGWEEQFLAFAGKTTNALVQSSFFPSTLEPYVSSSRSFEEHMITKSGCHLKL